ncbi:mandelate racemase/muconate lactonizing enzyme family protein [Roseovarius mucosus]|uniref:mandelate racemase/muconate lactonizing enzyme family protein n=1 Tax=Roseovarius mucosus TaxID=215743 RepID=UPI003F7193FE
MRIRLLHRNLRYLPEFVLQTASSGAVPALSSLYLVLEDGAELLAFGEVRENIEYLSGVPAAMVRSETIRLVRLLDWSCPPEVILSDLHALPAHAPTAVALIDCLLHDWIARNADVALCAILSGARPQPSPTNQTLFWSEPAAFEERATDYVARGFTRLKLRFGMPDFADDLWRLKRLREMFGDSVTLSADVNGAWSEAEALSNIEQAARHDIEYIEQPIQPGDWAALDRLARQSGVLVMADESLASATDLEALLRCQGRVGGHLKLVKTGGIAPLIRDGNRLKHEGVPIMVGQMNEGAGATAAALHAATALDATMRELYGADGLQNDPVRGLQYVDGLVSVSGAKGLGVDLSVAGLDVIEDVLQIPRHSRGTNHT